jgi:hypothetical protein
VEEHVAGDGALAETLTLIGDRNNQDMTLRMALQPKITIVWASEISGTQ